MWTVPCHMCTFYTICSHTLVLVTPGSRKKLLSGIWYFTQVSRWKMCNHKVFSIALRIAVTVIFTLVFIGKPLRIKRNDCIIDFRFQPVISTFSSTLSASQQIFLCFINYFDWSLSAILSCFHSMLFHILRVGILECSSNTTNVVL